MSLELIEKQLAQISAQIDTRLSSFEGKMKDTAHDAEAVKAATAEYKAELTTLTNKWAELQKQVDKIDASKGYANGMITKSHADRVKDRVFESESFKAFANRSTRSGKITLEGDAFKDTMINSNSITGRIPQYDQVLDMPVYDPDRPVHIRQYMAGGTTNSSHITYPREASITDATAMVAEGANKPQSQTALEEVTNKVKKIATHVRVSTEMLNDIAFLSSYLSARFLKKLRVLEDYQILYGDDTGENLQGVSPLAMPFFADAGTMLYLSDVLARAKALVRNNEYAASAILLNPLDYTTYLELAKDAEDRYLLPNVFSGGPITIGGTPIFQNTAIVEGDFLVGDFRLGAQLFDRMQAEVRFFEQDQDNAIKNLVTIVFEERLVNAVYRPNAFCYGTITAAIDNYSA